MIMGFDLLSDALFMLRLTVSFCLGFFGGATEFFFRSCGSRAGLR